MLSGRSESVVRRMDLLVLNADRLHGYSVDHVHRTWLQPSLMYSRTFCRVVSHTMAQKKNSNKQSGQLARQSQNQSQKNSAPVAKAVGQTSTTPKVFNGKRMIRVSHRELVSTISGNTTFGVNQYYLNPGLAASFPWLSTIAGSFEQYRFTRLKFHYVTRAPTSYKGSILMAPDYDSLDSVPSTEIIASQMDGAVEDSPWKEQTLVLNVQDMFPMGPRKYIRTGLISSTDLKTYDAGQIFVCTVSCDDTSALGKLWVDYEVELHIPQNPSNAGAGNVGGLASYQLVGGAQALATGVAEDVIFDNENYNTLGVTRSSGVYTIPPGSYLVSSVVNVADSESSGSCLIELIALKDGAAMSPVTIINTEFPAFSGVTSCQISIPFQFFISGTANFTLRISVEVTSGAGTLTLPDQMSYLNILKVA